MEEYVIFWLVVTILFVIIELLTVGLTSIWFAAGSLGAFVAAILGGNIFLQAAIFIVISIALLCMTKPWAKKYINSKAQKTNVDSIVGQRAILTEDVDNLRQKGKAIVMGQEWTVRAEDDNTVIAKGTLIEVVNISGVKLIVKRVKED